MLHSAVAAASAPRNASLDHLRVVLTALVILHHTAIVYGGSGGWYWKQEPDASQRLLLLFNAVNQSYFMGFFFLLAGYFTPGSFDRKGPARYLGERFVRLGLPLLAYVLVLSPLTIALAHYARGQPFMAAWGERYREHDVEPGPLWFAWALLLFALAYVSWRRLTGIRPGKVSRLPSPVTLLLAAIVVGAASFLVRLAVPVGHNVLWLQLGYFPPYILLFILGCMAAPNQLLERITATDARPWLITSAIMLVLLPVVLVTAAGHGDVHGGWSFNAAFYALWDPLTAWGIILGLLWSFRTYFPEGNRFTEALARQAFGAYIVHPPVVVALSLLARNLPMHPLLKFGLVGMAACVGAFAVSSLLLLIPPLRKVL